MTPDPGNAPAVPGKGGDARRSMAGGVRALADFALALGVLLAPVSVLEPLLSVEQPGSAAVIPPAAVLAAMAVWQRPGRALSMLGGLAAALGVCAVVWPWPDLAWAVSVIAAIALSRTAHAIAPLAIGGPRQGVVLGLLGLAGVVLCVGVLTLPTSAVMIAYHLIASLAVVLFLKMGWWMVRPGDPGIDRLGRWWERRAVARLAARGLQPLQPGDAPVYYFRVEPDGDGWAYEVCRGQTTLVAGQATGRVEAEREAEQACWQDTFRPPRARRPGGLYVLASPAGNPYQRQVTDLGH